MSNSADDPGDGSWHNRHNPYGNVPVQVPQEQPPNQNEVFHHNELYAMSGMYANPAPTMQGNFTMLPVGHGNYVKVFHQPENDQQPVAYNSYELFAPNSFIPHHHASLQQPQLHQSTQGSITPELAQAAQSFHTTDSATNMIINRLVTNWKPNVSGTYSPFGEQNAHLKNFNHVIEPVTPPSSEPLLPNIVTEKNFLNTSQNGGVPKTNGSFENSASLPEVRKRIVAEVKPMRMSYSDVLSKNVEINRKASNENNTSNYSSSSDSTSQLKSSKTFSDKTKSGTTSSEKKSSSDEKDKSENNGKTKKTDSQNSFRNDDSSGSSQTNSQKDKRKSNNDETSRENGSNFTAKSTRKSTQPIKGKPKISTNGENSKRRSTKRDNDDEAFVPSSSTENEKEFYYNVTKNETSCDRQPKSTSHSNNSMKKTRLSAVGQKNSFRSSEKSNFYLKRNQKSHKNAKYELVIKFAQKWYEYMVKILSWLFYLVYDIIVLGFGMVYDRLNHVGISLCSFFVNLRQELKNNSGKPSAWIKNLFKKIDGKFPKNSKWAAWRRFSEKKQQDPTPDFYENGRLPQTGDEAMYSLLNCKGKDAYSILGVPSESSPEQIRKHYKKIAVLVHPDKNKQPGAEEAFKVLQRAFELIGEPENRRSYDQSLAEELDAKKAWSELHDLLSQLQQKIAEAANTIRCSSCGLRHPRKLTERPHYAARECSSCKIRHSAREGDIWTETGIFGLRWRYLALMEGKVYDITEWANCQKGALSYLQPNSHIVQYRIVRGVQEKQQHEKQNKERSKRELGKLLDNIYSGHNPQAQQSATTSRRRTKRN